MDQYPIAASSLEKYYHINGKQFERQYKDHFSGYRDWEAQEGIHAEQYLIFPENIGPRLSIDETSLSDGELYTIVTNKDAHGGKGAIVAIMVGTKAWDIAETSIPQGGDKNLSPPCMNGSIISYLHLVMLYYFILGFH